MKRTLMIFGAVLAIAGCSATQDRVIGTARPGAVLVAPQPATRQAPMQVAARVGVDPSLASLRPGRTYVASFPEAHRRAACERLDYQEGTRDYAKCLQGDFPENPYFAQGRD